MALCSARQGGVYYIAAEHIRQSMREPGLEIRVIETRVPLDNLNRMARGECDAAMAQRDALMVFALANVWMRLKIAVPIDLYDALLHLVCRHESDIDDVGDLLGDPERYTLLTGEPGAAETAVLDERSGARCSTALLDIE